jgi:hypothetical protein
LPARPPAETAAGGSNLMVWAIVGGGSLALLLVLGLVLAVVLFLGGSADEKTAVNKPAETVPTDPGPVRPPPGRRTEEPPVPPPQVNPRDFERPPLVPGLVKPADSPAPGKGGRLPPIEVEFLGSIGKGNRFVFIADRSGSMGARVPSADPLNKQRQSIDLLHEELIKSLQSLKEGSYFYVAFFDDRVDPMPGGDTWVEGGKPLDEIIAWVRTVRPRGGTQPLPGFRKAFQLNPRPDVIFFMTDGQFGNIAAQVAELNGAGPDRARINGIQFVPPRAAAGVTRYALLAQAYDLPGPVRQGFERYTPKVNVKGPAVPFQRLKQMEDIAKESGGTFTVYGDKGADMKPAGPPRMPLLAVEGRFAETDPPSPKRKTSRQKSFDVDLQAGTTYQIDLVGETRPALTLEDAVTGRPVATGVSTGYGALITYRPEAAGRYRIQAVSAGRGLGAFVLTVIDRPLQ